MFVLSVEGPAFVHRGTWTTHKVLGCGPDRETALASVAIEDFDDECMLILTDLSTGVAKRIPTSEKA